MWLGQTALLQLAQQKLVEGHFVGRELPWQRTRVREARGVQKTGAGKDAPCSVMPSMGWACSDARHLVGCTPQKKGCQHQKRASEFFDKGIDEACAVLWLGLFVAYANQRSMAPSTSSSSCPPSPSLAPSSVARSIVGWGYCCDQFAFQPSTDQAVGSRCFGCTNPARAPKARTGQSPNGSHRSKVKASRATGRAPTWSTLAPHDEYLPPIRGGRTGKLQQLRLKTQLYLAPDKRQRLC